MQRDAYDHGRRPPVIARAVRHGRTKQFVVTSARLLRHVGRRLDVHTMILEERRDYLIARMRDVPLVRCHETSIPPTHRVA